MCDFSINPFKSERLFQNNNFSSDEIIQFHRNLKGYQPTLLISLTALAKRLNLGNIYVKDESHRFNLKAFKVMGASYAIYRYIKEKWEQTFGVQFDFANLYDKEKIKQLKLPVLCTATDGNHGRAVAYVANIIGLPAVIYMPQATVKVRIENIEKENAKVIVIDGSYDEAVERCARDARQNGWQIISDTSYPGYTEIPALITDGYSTIFKEIDPKIDFDLIVLQGGVGSFAASAVQYYRLFSQYQNTKLIVVEPTDADCLLESIKSPNGEMTDSQGAQRSIMAGLNCGRPSQIAWSVLRDGIDLFMSISDNYAKKAMKQYYFPEKNDQQIISGESGAAGLAALLALKEDNNLNGAKEYLNLNENSKILLFNTEGDTDPGSFTQITNC